MSWCEKVEVFTISVACRPSGAAENDRHLHLGYQRVPAAESVHEAFFPFNVHFFTNRIQFTTTLLDVFEAFCARR